MRKREHDENNIPIPNTNMLTAIAHAKPEKKKE